MLDFDDSNKFWSKLYEILGKQYDSEVDKFKFNDLGNFSTPQCESWFFRNGLLMTKMS